MQSYTAKRRCLLNTNIVDLAIYYFMTCNELSRGRVVKYKAVIREIFSASGYVENMRIFCVFSNIRKQVFL